jgi:hypothetical protein
MTKKLLVGTVGMIGLAAEAARHVAWYLSHQVNPSPRDGRPDGQDRT